MKTSSEKLSYSTIRIECDYKDGSSGTGTGFFFNFLSNLEKNEYIPVIITNKHVINNSIKGRFIFTTADENGEPIDTNHFNIEIDDFETSTRKHPESDVDLCAIPIARILQEADTRGVTLYYSFLDKELIPDQQTEDEMNALEEVLMIGYPNGIWDYVNNKPIFRRGITASHPKLNYCGKKEIIIDVACFPGSSGSPVFIFNEGMYKTKNGRLSAGDRIILLGVLYAGTQYTAEGQIRVVDVPTSQKPISLSLIPNNLGLIIKSERILELGKLFLK